LLRSTYEKKNIQYIQFVGNVVRFCNCSGNNNNKTFTNSKYVCIFVGRRIKKINLKWVFYFLSMTVSIPWIRNRCSTVRDAPPTAIRSSADVGWGRGQRRKKFSHQQPFHLPLSHVPFKPNGLRSLTTAAEVQKVGRSVYFLFFLLLISNK